MRRKKKGFGYYLYAVVTLVLLIAIIVQAFLLLFHVQKIEVEGTNYTSDNQIVQWIKEDPYTQNSLYAYLKIKSGHYKLPVYLEDVEIVLGLPWKLHIRVTEKEAVGCVVQDGGYTYFDTEGLVLLKTSEQLEGLPMIEGLDATGVELYEVMPIENERVFSYVVQLSEALKKYALSPDRVVWEEDSMNAYFADACVKFGKSNYDDKALQLTAILEHLEGKAGTLNLEHYSETNNGISFEEKKTKK